MSRQALKAAIIADDLTGALDAAAPFARRGLHTRVAIGPDSLDQALNSGAAVVSVNTDSRHLPPRTAAALTAASVERLAAHAPRLLIKKIDSTLRGNVVAESIAALEAVPGRNLLICPAMPAQGRVLQEGILYVHGVPLPESPIGRDERSPPPKEPLADLFRAARPDLGVLPLAAGTDPRGTISDRIVIADATGEDHLERLARETLPNTGRTLFVGAGGLTAALADAAFGPVVKAPAPDNARRTLLFLVGSRNPQSAAQCATLLTDRPDCLILEAPAGHVDGGTLAGPDGLILVRPSHCNPAVELDADEVADALAIAAAKLLDARNIGAVLATGGDTVLALLRQMRIDCLEIMGELQPGVVWSRLEIDGRTTELVTKAGGFGNDRLFLDVADWFGGADLGKKENSA
jgi:uncharacterized protein YgbK (DUF1537 family)